MLTGGRDADYLSYSKLLLLLLPLVAGTVDIAATADIAAIVDIEATDITATTSESQSLFAPLRFFACV